MIGDMAGSAMSSAPDEPDASCTKWARTPRDSCSPSATFWSAGCCCVRRTSHQRSCRGGQRHRPRLLQGKVAAARWFARQVLPRLAAERAIAEATDNDVMDLDEAAF